MRSNPFVVGQWVRGSKFYGRAGQIEEILEGPRNWVWLLGTRRIGKTSFLKQLELLTSNESPCRYLPVFWDFQGADELEELRRSFNEALLDASERLEAVGLSEEEMQGADLFESIGRLRRTLRSKGLKLLLLCDEVEELIKLNQKDDSILRKLRRTMQSHEDIRSVLTSTIRLWALSEQGGDTSPFLHGFTPPVYLRGLEVEDSRRLIHQENLPGDRRPEIDSASAERIRILCDNHPYLMQIVCKQLLELGDLDQALEAVAADQMVSYFFSVDFEMLSRSERDVLRVIGDASAASSDSLLTRLNTEPGSLSGALLRLEQLGYIRRDGKGRFVLVNDFFRRWLREQPDSKMPEVKPGPASQESADTVDAPPPLLFDGRYRLLREIGRGAMGVVYEARDEAVDELLAVKILKPEYRASETILGRFRREILLGRDITHPNILRVYHLGNCDGQMYLAMKLVRGRTLAGWIRSEGRLDLDRVVDIGLKLASALEEAHSRSVVHRDIKPQNILIDDGGEPFLTDFGLARLLDAPAMTQEGVFIGTPQYASPEQASLVRTDKRSDLYSLGLVLYEMVTGQRPFQADSSEALLELHRSAPAPDPADSRPGIPRPFSKVILRCLEKDRNRRYQSASDLKLDLERLKSS